MNEREGGARTRRRPGATTERALGGPLLSPRPDRCPLRWPLSALPQAQLTTPFFPPAGSGSAWNTHGRAPCTFALKAAWSISCWARGPPGSQPLGGNCRPVHPGHVPTRHKREGCPLGGAGSPRPLSPPVFQSWASCPASPASGLLLGVTRRRVQTPGCAGKGRRAETSGGGGSDWRMGRGWKPGAKGSLETRL